MVEVKYIAALCTKRKRSKTAMLRSRDAYDIGASPHLVRYVRFPLPPR